MLYSFMVVSSLASALTSVVAFSTTTPSSVKFWLTIVFLGLDFQLLGDRLLHVLLERNIGGDARTNAHVSLQHGAVVVLQRQNKVTFFLTPLNQRGM